jgi:hypothetical protein
MAIAQQDPERRRKLALLDSCLDLLESAHERDEVLVAADSAAKLQRHVPSITAGMRIADAIERVLEAEEACLPADRDACLATPLVESRNHDWREIGQELVGNWHVSNWDVEVGTPRLELDREQALALTRTIIRGSQQLCLLVLAAYELSVASALGYSSWDAYVRAELGMSRSRSYELLDQARVILAIRAAAGIRAMPDISAYVAGAMKGSLPMIARSIKSRTEGLDPDGAMAVIVEAVTEARAQLSRRKLGARYADGRDTKSAWPTPAPGADPSPELEAQVGVAGMVPRPLQSVVNFLKAPPRVDDVLTLVPPGELLEIDIPAAVNWLWELEKRLPSDGNARSSDLPKMH